MENINVTLGIDDEAIERLADKVSNVIDIGDEVKSVIEDYDFSDEIDSYLNYNVDFKQYVTEEIENISISEYIDVDDINLDSKAEDMLSSYSPVSGCSTAQAFTTAIEKAVRYLLLKNDDFVENIANALEKRIEKSKREEMKQSIIEEVKPLFFDEFKADLERYAAQVNQSTTSNPAVVNQTTTHWFNS